MWNFNTTAAIDKVKIRGLLKDVFNHNSSIYSIWLINALHVFVEWQTFMREIFR